MENEKALDKPQSINERITDKIKTTFIDLVSDDEWNKLVKESIERFTVQKTDEYNGKVNSELDNLVHTALREVLSTNVKKQMEDYITDNGYGLEGQVNENVKKIIVDNAGQILSNIFGNMLQGAINNGNNSY